MKRSKQRTLFEFVVFAKTEMGRYYEYRRC